MYHYPTKEALMEGLVRHASQSWAALLEQHAGYAATELSVWERYRAYLHVATQTQHTRADYWVLSDALYHPTLLVGWREHLDPWLNTTEAPVSAVPLLTSVRFLADGAWISAATGLVSEAEAPRVLEHGLALIDQAETLTATEKGTT